MSFTYSFYGICRRFALAALICILVFDAQAQTYDLNGLWARKTGVFAPNSGISVTQMIADNAGNVYICGQYWGTASLSDNTCVVANTGGYPYSASQYNGYSDGAGRWYDGSNIKSDGFVTKYDNKGAWQWTVRLSSETRDVISNIALVNGGSELALFGVYGAGEYSGLTTSTPVITYGNGDSEYLTNKAGAISYPSFAAYDFFLAKVRTDNGSKVFTSSLGSYMPGNDRSQYNMIYVDKNEKIYNIGINAKTSPTTQIYWKAKIYNTNGALIDSIVSFMANNGTVNGFTTTVSKNSSIDNMYILREYTLAATGQKWDYFISKVDLSGKTISNLSHISYYTHSNSNTFFANYNKSGIQASAIDVNNAETYLFVAGDTRMDFTYKSTGDQITNSGGLDGILVCYDPQQADTTANIRWMVNLRSAGEERFTDCKFDETTQTLHTVGYISQTPVNFNPKGTAMNRASVADSAMFYAVYDMDDGTCKSVQIMDAPGNEIAHKISFTDNNSNVVLFGNFSGSPFQVDPSGRLSPLRTTDPANVIAKFSFSPTELPDPRHAVSYGSADNVKSSYGAASHEVMSCLKLGALNNPIEHTLEYQPKHTAGAVGANPNHDGLQSITFPSSGGMRITVNASNTKNSPADLAAWADFNNNGKFDPGEISSIVTLAPNVGTVSPDLAWSAFPVITKAKQNNVPLRIRLTSEPLDGSWGEGDAADGEVEDYLFDIDLIDVSKTVTPARAKVGDTLTYTVTVENKSPASLTFTVFDPRPQYTQFAGGFDPVAGSTANITLDGQLVEVVGWPASTLSAGDAEVFRFKAKVVDAPQLWPPNDSIISNVAYVVLNGDTIPSTGLNCDVTQVKITALAAVDDTVKLWAGRASKFDVLGNDEFYGCTPTIAVTNGQHGTAIVVGDSILYTPSDLGYQGPDTLTYTISCTSTGNSTAKVYIMLHQLPDNIIDVDGDDCFVPGTSFDFNVRQQWSVAGRANCFTGPLVGDLDGDGIPEIITIGQNMTTFYVTDGATGTLKWTLTIPIVNATGGWAPVMTAVMVDADANGRGEIILATSNGYLNSYEVNISSPPFGLTQKWGAVLFDNPTGATDRFPHPIIADLDGNGVPELIVYNQIFNAATGAKLGETETPASTAYVGRNPYRAFNKTTNFMTVADFDGDGLPEIVAGGKVFKVSFSPDKTLVTCSIWRQTPSIPDGFTAVADVDMDGLLDAVVVYAQADGSTWVGVWSPLDNRLIDNFHVYTDVGYTAQSFPFIGDIDGFVIAGKKYPEICVTIRYAVKAYKYDPSTKKYSLKWTLTTSDDSGGTGITLFDFNNDGVSELVYRDETLLRILNGVADGTSPVLADVATSSIPCGSGTSFEYPVIADTDGDGSANICVTCRESATHYLRTYESAGRPWSSTRKVWNQVNYEPLYINEDLTVPKYPIPKNMEFDGKHPYNGALIQVPTMVDGNFNIVQVAPDPAVDSIWFEQYGTDSVRIYLRVKNLSAKRNVNQNLPVALYNAAVSADTTGAVAGGTNYILSKPLGETILPGDVHTMYFNIIKTKMSNQMSVRIQDDGAKYPASGSFLDCDYSNNAGVFGNLLAFDDRAVTSINTLLNIDILANDLLGSCTSANIAVDTVANKGPRRGSLTIKADKSFDYLPNANFYGVDSLDYYIKCGADSSAARVYIAVLKQRSPNYFACPGAQITLKLISFAGISFYWYDAPTGGNIVNSGSNRDSIIYTKTSNSVDVVWVEARYGSIIFPRHKVELLIGSNCGGNPDPNSCLTTGSIVWKEDFDSYGPGDRAPDPGWKIAGKTTYNYTEGDNSGLLPKVGCYALLTGNLNGNPLWSHNPLFDHTSPGDNSKGYFLSFDATRDPGQFYEFEMHGLCEGADLLFSAWLMNINPLSWPGSPYVTPMVEFRVEDLSGNLLGVFNTGSIDRQTSPTWVNYAFPFTVPVGVTDVRVRFMNAQLGSTGTQGNDISIDDIEVRLCAPPLIAKVNGKLTDTICGGDNVQLTVEPYNDNGVFVPVGSSLKGYWLISTTGNINNPGEWTQIASSAVVGSAPLSVPSVTDSPPANDTVYYRFVMSSEANVNKPNCRAYSAVLPVVVFGHSPNYPDIRIQLCSGLASQIHLSSYLDTVNFQSLQWSVESGSSPGFVTGTTTSSGTLNTADFSLGTHIYKYEMANSCNSSGSGRVYIKHTTNPVVPSLLDTIVICQSIPSAAHLQLNQMLGLEAGGTWLYNANLNPYVITLTAPSKFAGAYIFDATAAWTKTQSDPAFVPYQLTYNGDTQAAAFTFTYKTDPQACFGNRERKLVLVVTSRVLPLH